MSLRADVSTGISDEIRKIIFEELRYALHYEARVLNVVDTDNAGDIQVTIAEFEENGVPNTFWASPQYRNDLKIPKVGELVDVYFRKRDPSFLVYTGTIGIPPTSYDGNPNNAVIYDNIVTSIAQKLNRIKIVSSGVDLGTATEPMVKGTTLQTQLNNLNARVEAVLGVVSSIPAPVASMDGGATLVAAMAGAVSQLPPASFNNILSQKNNLD